VLDPVWGLILPLGYDSSAEVGAGNPLEGRRALARVERQYLDAQRAVDHESLHDLSRVGCQNAGMAPDQRFKPPPRTR
jgi:hypothetical protein